MGLCSLQKSARPGFNECALTSTTNGISTRFSKVNGETYYTWRAVDHEGEVLDVFVTKHCDRKAALNFLRKLMKRYGRPELIVTGQLRSYDAALKDVGAADRQETGRWLNSRAENSHLPFCRPERAT